MFHWEPVHQIVSYRCFIFHSSFFYIVKCRIVLSVCKLPAEKIKPWQRFARKSYLSGSLWRLSLTPPIQGIFFRYIVHGLLSTYIIGGSVYRPFITKKWELACKLDSSACVTQVLYYFSLKHDERNMVFWELGDCLHCSFHQNEKQRIHFARKEFMVKKSIVELIIAGKLQTKTRLLLYFSNIFFTCTYIKSCFYWLLDQYYSFLNCFYKKLITKQNVSAKLAIRLI
jgi:hypothetical protein